MNITPLNDMVYIEVDKESKEKMTPGGLHLVTDDVVVDYKVGTVLAAVESDNVKMKKGDRVILPPQINALKID